LSLREIFRDATMISGSNIATSVLNFFAFLIMINVLGAYGFGLLSLSLSILAIATIFLDLGLGKLVVSDAAKDLNEGKKGTAVKLFNGYLLLQCAVMLIIVIVSILGAEIIANHFQKDITLIIRLVSALIVLGAVKNIYSTEIQITSNFKRYSEFLFYEAVLKIGFIAAAVYFLPSVEGMLIAMFASELLTLCAFWTTTPHPLAAFSGIGSAKDSIFEMLSKHGKWSVLFSQLRNIESNISLWIVGFFLGVSAVGIYSALLKIQVIAIRIFEPLETIFYPLVSKLGKLEDSRKIIFRATKYILYLSIPGILVLMVFCEFAIATILGQDFVPYANVLRVLLLTVFIFILNIPLKPFLYNLKAQKELTFLSIIVLASTLIIGSALTFYFGLIGIALNHLITPLIDLLLKRNAMIRITNTKYSLFELFVLDKNDFDLLKKILADPIGFLGGKK